MQTCVHNMINILLNIWNEKCFKRVEISNTHILCAITFLFRKPCRLRDNVDKYERGRQATDDNKIRLMRVT